MNAEQLSKHYGVEVKPQDEQIAERVGQMPRSFRNVYQKAMSGRSMKSAIKSNCLECMGWQREEVKLCTDLGCPLYPYRPTSFDYKVVRRTITPSASQETAPQSVV